MNIKKNFLFLIFGLLMTFLLPNYAWAKVTAPTPTPCSSTVTYAASTTGFGFASLDTQGKLLCFDNPTRTTGTGAADGNGRAYEGDVYTYTNVITINGSVVNATVSVNKITNATLDFFDQAAPNPNASNASRTKINSKGDYITSFGLAVPEAAIFAPRITSEDFNKEATVNFTISFQDANGNAVVLKNVYNNSLDDESTEYNAYGGFSSYTVAGDNAAPNTPHIIATNLDTKIRFSSSDCAGDGGLYIKDQSRVQAKFATIQRLQLTLGQFANGTVPNGTGGFSPCTNSGVRAYGAIFAQDNFTDSGTPIEITAPTVNLLTTLNTKPTVTGTIGGTVSTASPNGSALSGTETFSVAVNGVTYSTTPTALISTQPSGRLTVSGTTWTLQFLTPLAINTPTTRAYEVIATRNNLLIDQTNNELVITDTCVAGKVWDTVTFQCKTPLSTDLQICHSGDNVNFARIIIATTDTSHLVDVYDVTTTNGLCPGEQIDCSSLVGKVASPDGTACITPVAPTITQPASTTNSVAIPLGGVTGSTATISSVTLTKSGVDTPLSGIVNPSVSGGNWSVSSGAVTVGTYTITVTDANSKAATGTLTVTCGTNTVVNAAGTLCIPPVDMWNGLPVSEILALNAKWNNENYLNNACQTTKVVYATNKEIDTEWVNCPRSGGTFKNRVRARSDTYEYECIFEVTGSGISGTFKNDTKFTINPALSVAEKWALIARNCNTVILPPTVSCTNPTSPAQAICTGNVGTSTALTITIGTTPSVSITPVTANGTWTYTAPVLVAGTYAVSVTGSGGTATATGNLLVNPSLPPVVITPTSTTELVPVDIHGTFGTSTTISNFSVTLTKTGTNAVTPLGAVSLDPPTANGWKVSSGALAVGNYTIVATDANGLTSLPVTLTVTCANSKVANAASNACISAPTVTASQTFSTTTPVITGTVGSTDAMGNPILGTTEAFKVAVNGVTYTYKTDAALSVVGTAWTLTIPLTAGQSYPVVATRDGTLSNAPVNITINGAPTVTAHPDTFDTTPVITGAVGATALGSDTFSVKINNQTYPYAAGVTTDGNVIVNADFTWRLTIPTAKKLPAGTYPIQVVRNTLSGTGSIIIKPCALPSVVNETADTCSIPVPTVVAAAWNSNTPAARIITGTVGDVPLGSDETFTVTITNTTTSAQIYTHATPETDLKVTGMIWTLTIPTVTEIIAGKYSVEAARNTTAKNTDTAMKLQVTLVCNPNQTAVNGGCVPQTILPTVDNLPTTDTTPVITGTVGTLPLTNSEIFTVKVDDTPFTATISDKTWSVVIPVGSALSVGAHTVVATRGSISGTGIITVTDCTSLSGKRLDTTTGKCVDVSLVPTVNKPSASHDVNESRIVVSGTFGDTALTNSDTFTITITDHSNPTKTLQCPRLTDPTSTTWECQIVKPTIGTFDVTAARGSKVDITNSELVITDNIAICDMNKTPHDQSIPKTSWDGRKEGIDYYLGQCNVSSTPKPKPCTEYPGSPQTLPLQKSVTESPICDDGGARSEIGATGVTIKRGTIINGTTKNGTVTLINNPSVIYGEKASATGNMDISNATIGAAIPTTASCVPISGTTSGTIAAAVTLTGVTLNNAYIESSGRFNADTGEFTPSDSWIKVSQGTTSPTDETATPNWISTIVGGVITAGTDTSGNPIRGSINSGRYDVPATDADRITRSRRVTGKIVGATVTNATTMTSGGSTFVLSGTITAGTFEGDNSAFGTVVNASITGTNLSNSNHCFSSGTVGTRGQLNWKEVIKE